MKQETTSSALQLEDKLKAAYLYYYTIEDKKENYTAEYVT
jgi:hypothetical protein